MAKIQDIRNGTQRTNDTRYVSQIKYIVRHHSATDSGDFDTFWRHWNGTRGWGTGGYHEIILRDGTVQLCYDPNEITNGVANHNHHAYHICLVGNGSFTAAQEKAWDERIKYNMDRLNIKVDYVKGHKEMPGASTACPGIDMNKVRNRIKNDVVAEPIKSNGDTYIVKKGNTLWGIAKANDTTVAVLKQLNGLNDNLIHPGDKIKLPGASKPKEPSFKVGNKVKVKSSASKYATGQSIPSWVKCKTYTIQQVKSDRVLLKEIVSWVFKKDVQ